MANVYSVKQINQYISRMFSSDFLLRNVTVSGEVSNCKYHTSGHIYFTIKEENSALKAIMFFRDRSGLDFKMADGMRIVVSGSIGTYEKDGTYQLYAKHILKEGEGALYQKFLALKKELEEMGMFDPMYKKPIPAFVKTVGIVTADTGAAVRDIISVATRRNPGVKLVLCPAKVQGDGAAESIIDGINRLEVYGVDVIIAGRGGGSIEDLWAFNDERLARTVFECSVPLISAVGHETDFTIMDFVADLRAATPSAAAELAVNDIDSINRQYDDYRVLMTRCINDRCNMIKSSIDLYKSRLKGISPINVLNARRMRTDEYRDRLDNVINNRMAEYKHKLQLICARLEAQSPVKKMAGGYSYVRNEENSTVLSINDVNIGDNIKINVNDGLIYAKVTETKAAERG